jgi:pimeloyl-ACP methyl ester carboxylesterase
MQTSLFASGKVHLLGVSAGGLGALNWAKNNPTLVQSITLLIPVLNVIGVDSEDRGSFSSAIQTAYGGSPTSADNPLDYAADLDGIPGRAYYSTTDAITEEDESTAFCADSGFEAVSMGAHGHFWDAPWSGINAGNFIREND